MPSKYWYAIEWEYGRQIVNRCTLWRFASRAERDAAVAIAEQHTRGETTAPGWMEAIRISKAPRIRAQIARQPEWWMQHEDATGCAYYRLGT